MSDNTKKVPDLGQQKEKEIDAKLDEAEQQAKAKGAAAQDVYSNIESRDPETGVETPTEDAVHEAKAWVDEENRK